MRKLKNLKNLLRKMLVPGVFFVMVSLSYAAGPCGIPPDTSPEPPPPPCDSYGMGDNQGDNYGKTIGAVIGSSTSFVHLGRGNLCVRDTDLEVPGRIPIEVRRSYNSVLVNLMGIRPGVSGHFGMGWNWKYDAVVIGIKKIGPAVVNERLVLRVLGDGVTEAFSSPDGVHYSASQGVFDVLGRSASGKFEYRRKDQTIYSFEDKEEGLRMTFPGTPSVEVVFDVYYLTKIEDGNGNTVGIVRGSQHEPQRIYTLDGTGIDIETEPNPYDALHRRITMIRSDDGREVTYQYNDSGQLTEIKGVSGESKVYAYATNGLMTAYTDEGGNTRQFEYDNQCRCVKVTDANGNAYRMSYDYTWIFNPLTLELRYSSGTTRYTEPNGHQVVREYNERANFEKETDGDRITTFHWTRDQVDRVDKRVFSDGTKKEYEFSPTGETTKYTDPAGSEWQYTYHPVYHKVTEIRNPVGEITGRYGYDPSGNVASATDALGRITEYSYNVGGDLVKLTDPLGNETGYTYDSRGNLLTVKDASGNVTGYTYDLYGNMASTTDALGNITRYTYDISGRLVRIVDVLGNADTYTYNVSGRLIRVENPNREVTTYTYDAAGNLTSTTDPQGRVTGYEYDANNRVIAEIDPAGGKIEYAYDSRGNRVSVKDALGRVTQYEYDALNRLTAIVDAGNNRTWFTYDANGNLVSKTDPNGNTTTMEYDFRGSVIRKTYPDRKVYEWTYDAERNMLTKVVDGGLIESNTYDNLNRLIARIITGKGTIGYTYDKVSNVATFTNQQGGIIQYAYDAANRSVSITDPESRTTAYNYDSLGRRTRRTYPNGCYSAYIYDTKSQLLTIANYDPQGKIISSYFYTYDASGNRTSMLEPSRRTNYTYDLKSQLVGAEVWEQKGKKEEKTYGVVFAYDPAGNRLSMSLDTPKGQSLPFQEYAPTLDKQPNLKHPIKVTYIYNSLDQLLTESAYRSFLSPGGRGVGEGASYYQTDYTYDPNGNVITKVLTKPGEKDGPGGVFRTNYEYDYANLLNKITYPDGEVNTFRNCRCGTFRHQKVDSRGLVNYLYDKENDSSIFETDESYVPKVRYIKGPRIDELISRTVYGDDGTAKTYWYLYDGLGSVRQLVDERGKVAAEYDYTPFGEIIQVKHGEAKKNPYTYTGREYDRDSGLNFYRARYYDSRVGRFISRDPIGYEGGINLYAYCGNNPVRWVDPEGLIRIIVTPGPGGGYPPPWVPPPPTFGKIVVVSGITYFIGSGISVAIYAGVLNQLCSSCLLNAANYINYWSNRADPCLLAQWRKNAQPGTECNSICGPALQSSIQAFIDQLFWTGGFRPGGI